MGTIRLQGVTRQYGPQIVLDGVDLELHSGRIVGLVGPNGAGKTTLMRLITGAEEPDLGTVTRSRDIRIGYLAQEPEIVEGRSLHDEVLSVFEDVLKMEQRLHALSEQMGQAEGDELQRLMGEYDKANERFIAAGGYEYETRLKEILGGLGFREEEMNRPISVLSGGQKCRAALAKLLLQDTTYLLLDEPTNHLDIDAVRWLERFLAGHHGGAAIISHDRYLLDRLVDGIVEVDRRNVKWFPGNYTNYVKTSDLRDITQDRQFDKDKAHIEKEQAFIRKHLAGQRTKEAQGRRSRLERELAQGDYVLEKSARRRTVKFNFEVDVPEGHTLVEGDGLAKGFDGPALFEDVRVEVTSGQRIGITGPNGTGKSTLLKLLVGELKPDQGVVHVNPKAQVGYFAQDSRELDTDANVLQCILEVRPDFTEERTRSLLGGFNFRGEDVFKRIEDLSGGEQSRVRLLRLLLRNPNVLILDEPTNHLDIPSREALEQALDDYPGTIVVVSHDRYFLDRIVTELLVMRSGEHRRVRGNYSQYLAEIEAAAAPQTKTPRKKSGRKPTQKPAKTPRSKYEKLSLEELEKEIIEHEEQLARCHAQFSQPDVYKDGEAVTELRDEMTRLEAVLAEMQAAWEKRAEAE